MKAVVVFESMFGDNQQIANAIAAGLSTGASVEVVEVGVAPTTLGQDVQLLVVGGPTHTFGMSRPETRRQAKERAAHGVISGGIGLREWLAAVKAPVPNAAAFDTRINRPRWFRWFDRSAQGMEKRLRARLSDRNGGGAFLCEGHHGTVSRRRNGPRPQVG